MTIREKFEQRELDFLSPFACPSAKSKGRKRPEAPCPIRTAFQRDRDRIVYSNAFRRLKHKTQVFLSPLGDHYRTRLTHTLEVAEIARTIARAMRLNEDLTEAVALGHDLGHTPFGHGGETVLKELFHKDFTHSRQSLRVVDCLERRGEGLNLTYEVMDGIAKHSKGFGTIMPNDAGEVASTMEGRVVRVADIIAYLSHDLDDAIRSGVVTRDQVPSHCVEVLGERHRDLVTTMIRDVVYSSGEEDGQMTIKMSDAMHDVMLELRTFLYDNVYRAPVVHNEFIKAKKILSELFDFYLNNVDAFQKAAMEQELFASPEQAAPTRQSVCDLIASMTDRFALTRYQKIFFPTPMV
ncbi:dGTPase [Desulfatibacillum alkenivorans DSM 16219]|jgi:dGTPase|uniref:Deoxyguanosinetriphosphate triphosphohydrolase-like protein n=1 Tax=Desulfatibacillum alkenivorans DSM 16219 TaxID=1121393 RepID=A0A1M6J971_9BACT|nr:deoxyguanosinetriphosphate triphosphohydrolase [Desulfatibacillum alkenivorans]SHJ43258.1 dGTPase [Desulfatibacillum alkenivorans DSM 16219]